MTTLYGLTPEQWLKIRDERDHYKDALRQIAVADGRTPHRRLRERAAAALLPSYPYTVAKLVLRDYRPTRTKAAR